MPELVSQPAVGARLDAGTGSFRGRPPAGGGDTTRPISFWAFTGVAVASFGGPLALAALNAPKLVADAAGSAGLAMLIAVGAFLVPLAIWLRYSRRVAGSGGLYSFVEAAAGRRVALVQASVWIVSYLLYLVYTTVEIVYDVLPRALPGERHYQTLLALGIPIALVAVMTAGRAAALSVLGLLAVGQLAVAGLLDGVTLAHVPTAGSSFGTSASAGSLASDTAQTSLLYICGSLPLFLGGEVARPARTIRRGLLGAYGLTAIVVVLAVAPLASSPGLLRTDLPGVSVAQQFAGAGIARAIGVGVAASIAGVMLCEYLALTRLVHAISLRRLRPITLAVGAVVLLAAPFTLIDPEGFYSALIKPSLAALWLSQLIVFAVYPRFVAKQGGRALPAWTLASVAGGLAIYGLWMTLQHAST